MLRVATTVVSPEGQGTAERAKLLRELILQPIGAALLVLPAGAVRAANEAGVRKAAAPLIAAAKKMKVAVLFGVDVGRPTRSAGARVKKGALPYFLVGWSPADGVKVWRQRSLTGDDAGDVPEGLLHERRSLQVAGQTIAPIACGEIYNPAIRSGIAELEPRLAVLSAHAAAGARHWAPQGALLGLGVPSVRSVHSATATVEPVIDSCSEPPSHVAFSWRGVHVRLIAFHDDARRRAA